MPLWELTKDALQPVARTTFQHADVWERRDLQRLLRDQIEVLDDELMVVAEEFSNWVHSDLRVDLLCIDRAANLVVIELKRDERGGHSELQAIRYAAMAAPATFDHVVEAHRSYTARRRQEQSTFMELSGEEARQAILDFLGWDEADDELFGNDVRIILASTDFSIPLTSAVLWLRNRGGIDIRCIRLVPYTLTGLDQVRLLVDVQQLVPLPEAADLSDRMADKEERKREARAATSSRDTRRFDLTVAGRRYQRLPKRRLAYESMRAVVVDRGVPPTDILERTADGRRRGERLFVRLSGPLDSVEAREALIASRKDANRFYTADEDLLFVDGDTWIFTKMWGENTEEFIRDLQLLVPDLPITVVPSDEPALRASGGTQKTAGSSLLRRDSRTRRHYTDWSRPHRRCCRSPAARNLRSLAAKSNLEAATRTSSPSRRPADWRSSRSSSLATQKHAGPWCRRRSRTRRTSTASTASRWSRGSSESICGTWDSSRCSMRRGRSISTERSTRRSSERPSRPTSQKARSASCSSSTMLPTNLSASPATLRRSRTA